MHVWATLADDEFLYRICAMDKTIDGNRLTKAGLLMFGNDYEIERVFPNYLIDYQEVMDETRKWTHRIKSDQGNWSGNVFDFFFKVFECLSSSIQSSFTFEQEIFREENSKLKEEFQPDRTILILPYSYHLLQKQSKKALDTLSNEENSVYRYLLNHATCTRKDIEELLHVSASKAKVLLLALIEIELATSSGVNKNRRYFLNGK